jgi:amino acid transporter
MLFFGRKRRGFPGLLVGVLGAAVALGALFGLPHGADLTGPVILLAIGVLVLLVLGSLVLVAIAAFRPPRHGKR